MVEQPGGAEVLRVDELEAQHLGDEVAPDLSPQRYLAAVYKELHSYLSLAEPASHLAYLHAAGVSPDEALFLVGPPWTLVGRLFLFCFLHCMVPFFQSV